MVRTVSLVACLSLLAGCFGSFRLTNAVWEFNRDLSDSIIVQEVVFLAFVIVPVYGVATFVDAIVLNTIEAFTGENPIGLREGEEAAVEIAGKPRKLRRMARRLELLDEGRTVASAELLADGSLRLVDREGAATIIDPLTLAAAQQAWELGGADALAGAVAARVP